MQARSPGRYTGPGGAFLEFAESFCHHSKGQWAGRLLRFTDWQVEIVRSLFAEDRPGHRRDRTAYIGLPRKNGKSTLGAALALYGLVADGEPGAEVYSCAGDRKQAEIVFSEAKRMVEADYELSQRIVVRRYYLEVPETNSIYRVLSADAKLQQGLNPSFVVFDEVHVQPNFDLWVAMTQGSGTRRQPLTVGITTAGVERDSLAYYLYDYGRRVMSRERVDPSFLFRWVEPEDPDCDWQSEDVWKESNPALRSPGAFLKVADMRKMARQTPENEFRRFRLNQWTSTYAAWLPHGAWRQIEDAQRAIPADEPVVLGFDGSWTRDSTALVACSVQPPHHLSVVACWEKPSDQPAWQVPAGEVDMAIHEAFASRNVVELVCDPAMWRQQLQSWADEGLPVAEFPTNSLPRMVPACHEFYAGVMEKDISHDGDPRLARHVANATIKADRFGTRIVKERQDLKIDLAVASVIAYERARYHSERAVSEPLVAWV